MSKHFKEGTALKEVTISFEKGKIHGIIGCNCSGKTVLFKCICSFILTSTGDIIVDGKRNGGVL